MRVPEGCALCESTWGDYWEQVEGQKVFFCCWICAAAFKNMVKEIRARTGWPTVDEIKIKGDYRGRECIALRGPNSYKFFVRFDENNGEIVAFREG